MRNLNETERKLIETKKKLEDKVQKLTNIIEGINLATWEWDMQTEDLNCNERWANMIGYALEELQPLKITTWYEFVHPEDLKLIKGLIQKHIAGEINHYELEIRMKHKDGRWIWVHDRGKITERDGEGQPIKMFGTHSDITLRREAEEVLKESEKRFFLALDETKAGLWDYDMINKRVFLSTMWKSILGYSDDETWDYLEIRDKIGHPEDYEKMRKAGTDYLAGNSKNYEVIHRLKHKDGNWRWILTRGGILRDEEGVPYRWIGTNIDVTREQEQALELERFLSINLDLLCTVDMEGRFMKVNKAWEELLGHPSKELKGRKFLEFVHPDDIPSTLVSMKEGQQGKKVHKFINRYLSVDETYHYIEWRSTSYDGTIYAAARDVTLRIEHEKEILERSNRDALTNAYNRRYTFDRAEEIIEEYKRMGKVFSVCILDIDYFKAVNDNYGHQAGDYILKRFTEIIDENLRPYDILGRYGGEEFIAILNNITKQKSDLIINRILDIIENEVFVFNGEKIKITFSGGISDCTEIGKDTLIIDRLVEIADKRMYQAKQTGRNRIISE